MQSFLGGDKGGSSNPLKQISQREGVDNSLFKDRFAPAGGSSGQSSSSSIFRPSNQVPADSAQSQSSSNALHATPHPFNLSHLSAALSQPQHGHGHVSPQPPQFDAQWEQARSNGHSPIPQMNQLRSPPPQAHQLYQHSHPQQQQQNTQQSGWSNDFQSYNQNQNQGKGKGRAVGSTIPQPPLGGYQNGYSNFAPQYGGGYQSNFTPMYQGMMPQPQLSAPQQQPQTHGAINQQQIDDLFAKAEADFKASSSVAEDVGAQAQKEEEGDIKEISKDPKGDLEAVWESLKPEAERLNKLAEWEKDFSQFTNNEDDLFDDLNDSLSRSEVGQSTSGRQADLGNSAIPDGFDQFSNRNQFIGIQGHDGIPQSTGYDFASNNTHDSSELAALWQEANHIISSGGSLTQAGLMLESFIRRATLQDRDQVNVSATEVWSLLGRVHAMDEKEEQALKAFEEGRKTLVEEGESVRGRENTAGEMLTNLAISYVNESLDLAALTVLHQYLSLIHPKYAGEAPSKESIMGTSASPWALHQSMSERFLNLARDQWQSNQSVDPNVQVGLGTLYYMMDNYEEARGCWTNALGEKPDDYLLWNRLGATLANGGNSEEAVDAYRRALELKPTFTRAMFNLGVACLNIGVYKESAEHLLAALSLHSTQSREGGEGDSDISSSDSWSIWSTLRRALVALDMNYLAGNAEPGTDLGVFRQAGFEF